MLVTGFGRREPAAARATARGEAPGRWWAERWRASVSTVPMLGGAPKMIRGMIIKSMGKAVPAAEKPHFMPLTEDEKPWRAVAHYDKSDDAYLLLVDDEGAVLWQTQGEASDAAYANLKKKLDGMLSTAKR